MRLIKKIQKHEQIDFSSSILEVDLEYPKNLHNDHNDFPLAVEQKIINRIPKLICSLYDKKTMYSIMKILIFI